jgi:hypothetical protein
VGNSFPRSLCCDRVAAWSVVSNSAQSVAFRIIWRRQAELTFALRCVNDAVSMRSVWIFSFILVTDRRSEDFLRHLSTQKLRQIILKATGQA